MATRTAAQVNNCYRAILAQVNQLDSLYHSKVHVKELYEDLTELAYYIMVDDEERIQKGIDHLNATIMEMDEVVGGDGAYSRINSIIGELRTHLDFILMNYQRHCEKRP